MMSSTSSSDSAIECRKEFDEDLNGDVIGIDSSSFTQKNRCHRRFIIY